MIDIIETRQRRIGELTRPLPGSVPCDQLRPLNVPQRFDRFTLLDFLDGLHPHYGLEHWKHLCDTGRILNKQTPVVASRIVRGGEQFVQLTPGVIEPEVNAAIQIIHEDQELLIIHKPAPLPVHPCGRFNRNSLTSILQQVYEPIRLFTVHRLDANTSGLVVFALDKSSAANVQQQFENRQVSKTYLARVYGFPEESEFTCETRISETPCDAGARMPDPDGLDARTDFRLIQKFPDGTSLIEAKPITGRTNQIRLHLWDLNLPIVGDPVYLRSRTMGRTQTLSITDPPMCLHAWRLEFRHPRSDEPLRFIDQTPTWATDPIAIDSI